jgi:ABC-type protease/lipase transport system fused ATPase/permease subunit
MSMFVYLGLTRSVRSYWELTIIASSAVLVKQEKEIVIGTMIAPMVLFARIM